MDGYAFKIIGNEVLKRLNNCRIEKVHSPFENITIFLVYSRGEKFYLCLKHTKQDPLFLVSKSWLVPNPPTPPNYIMKIRKHFLGRTLGTGKLNWVERTIELPLFKKEIIDGKTNEKVNTILKISLTNQPLVIENRLSLQDSSNSEYDVINAQDSFLIKNQSINDQLDNTEQQAKYLKEQLPVSTANLSESLAALSGRKKDKLLEELFAPTKMYFYQDQAGLLCDFSSWEFPEELCLKKGYTLSHSTPLQSSSSEDDSLFNCKALQEVFELQYKLLNSHLKALISKEEKTQQSKALKKHKKLVAKLEKEKERLTNLIKLQEQANMLKENLWQLPSNKKLKEVTVWAYKGNKSQEQSIILDEKLTVLENMQYFFAQSSKGKRGLSIISSRLAKAKQDYEHLANLKNFKTEPVIEKSKKASMQSSKLETGDKDVSVFYSSDNYKILRGKNARGNHIIRKLAKGYDLWLHIKDGASAHAVIRLNYPNEEVPRATLEEAASLVIEKSYKKDDTSADVMVAFVKDVSSIKGAPLGTVKLPTIMQSININRQKN